MVDIFLHDFFHNFNSLFHDLSATDTKFPKYNIIKLSDEEILIQLALAGYKRDDIRIEVRDNILSISGETKDNISSGSYLVHGIAGRHFEKQWTLPKNMEIGEAKFEDGILSISGKVEIPEEKKPKLIDIH